MMTDQTEGTSNVVTLKPKKPAKPRKLDSPEFSDDALALAWSAGAGEDWRYVTLWGAWYRWADSKWQKDERGAALENAREFMRSTSKHPDTAMMLTPAMIKKLCSKRSITDMMALAQCDSRHSTIPDDFDAHMWLLGTPDGVVNLKDGKLYPGQRDHLITKFTKVGPKHGEAPYWRMMLNRITNGDLELERFYQKWCGYVLTGDCSAEALLIAHGKQASGKSKFLNTIADLLGDYAVTVDIAAFMESKFQRHGSELAALRGSRLAISTEPSAGMRWNESLINKMTGREKMQAKKNYQDVFEFTATHKLWIGCNDIPTMGSSDGMERRLHLAAFPPTIPEAERITDLAERLQAEYPAILAWAIDGCLLWQAEGLERPKAIAEAVSEYVDSSDLIGDWLAECTQSDANERVKQSDLYASYAEHVKKLGHGALSAGRLGPELVKRDYRQTKIRGIRYIAGLRLIDVSQRWMNYAPEQD